ncbi:hypothetical protein OG978_06920 [Streptomyces sp. NBC_01591]|uniref:hypothetical protein n=1 Tax=Streptomyces sp. NBC_01591 TaxID=2975888 RepID=UPI002DD881CA|nr:hypothetical protein [Streptomyces sp. NBC_01591]WSD67137.1 hypothetical protein OG978_06920 [Streptomyces sp. NBC_01591]
MATIGYAGLPVPEGGDAPVGPGALADLATVIDSHLWQHVADLAERNSVYAGAPVHTVVTAENGSVWVKTNSAANTWATVWEPTPAWRTLPLASGFQAGQNTPQIRLIGTRVHMRGRIIRTDGGLIVGTNGIQVATVPADCKPQHVATSTAFFSMSGDPLVGAGRVEAWSDDETVPRALTFWSQDGAQDGGTVGTPWIDISGSYWID